MINEEEITELFCRLSCLSEFGVTLTFTLQVPETCCCDFSKWDLL